MKFSFSRAVSCALVLVSAEFSGVCFSQSVINVPADHPTIQAAIQSAQSGDLVLVAAGTYNEQIDFLGKAVSVIGVGGAQATTIDASNLAGWLDVPYYAIARFINAEGPGSVLQGFTLTGHTDATAQSAPVWSTGNPTLVGCVIKNNAGLQSGGFFGSGTLSGCTIDSNSSNQAGGGVSGSAQLFDCTISNNNSGSYNGGGLHTDGGMLAVRCSIIDNDSNLDGHSGGGVDGPATLIDCIIARNVGGEFGGQNMYGKSAISGALLVSGCTITENVFSGNGGYTMSATTIVDSIIWNNDQDFGEISFANLATYSLIDGGFTGMGNISDDPLLVDPANDDFSLQRTSPCLDAGDPASPLDPDGTRRDMGALFIPQFAASWSLRFGSSFQTDFQPTTNPQIGGSFDGTLTGPGVALIFGYSLPSSPIATIAGELLVDPTSVFLGFYSGAVPIGGVACFSIPIPNDTDTIGTTAATQAVFVTQTLRLSNAVDLVIGL